MKTIRAYGGTIMLWNTGNGWSWEIQRSRRYDPPRAIAWKDDQGRQLYVHSDSTHGFAHAATLRAARKSAVNMLKPR